MPELTPQERLQPALLDRLTDEAPEKRQEPLEQRVMSKRRLREAVLRDLAWLFNATRLEATLDVPKTAAGAERAPWRRSVINFGLPALSGKLASTLEANDLERAIRQSILDFEPRILPASLEVKALLETTELDHHNVIGVEIRGQLWAQPVPLELLVRTEIDLETGRVEIADLAPSRVA
jgi:type VI secretion system protein ImpF